MHRPKRLSALRLLRAALIVEVTARDATRESLIMPLGDKLRGLAETFPLNRQRILQRRSKHARTDFSPRHVGRPAFHSVARTPQTLAGATSIEFG